MPLEEPGWWYPTAGRRTRLVETVLAPLGEIYGGIVERRFTAATPYRSRLPVICVGNFTAGGTGKTPLTRFLIELLAAREAGSACLTRGYGGLLAGPVWVDPEAHRAHEVGDEPLLIAQVSRDQGGRVMVARDRRAGAEAIEAADGIAAVIMDDGLQNPSLVKDLSIAVVDARRGFGNGRVIPAGPLRADLDFQLGFVDCIVVMGADPEPGAHSVVDELKQRFQGPVLRGSGEPAGETGWIGDRAVIAYAGIANPQRFFGLLERLGADVAGRHVFADHHVFSEREASDLIAEADHTGALLVTTEKDYARLTGTSGACAQLAALSRTVPITVKFEERDLVRLRALVDGALKAAAAPRS